MLEGAVRKARSGGSRSGLCAEVFTVRRLFALLITTAALYGCAQATWDAIAPVSRPPGNKHVVSSVRHIVIIEMENRSFDHYFGTYPGVNGLPSPLPCNPDPQKNNRCIKAFHDTTLRNYGGPHGYGAFGTDLDHGKLDGFIRSAEHSDSKFPDPDPDEVMGFHTCSEIPVYCNLAQHGVLADNTFAATLSWSTMAHLFLVSAWSASCSVHDDPMSCVPDNKVNVRTSPPPDYAWTDVTWLLHAAGVSWGYYVYNKGAPELPWNGDGEAPDLNIYSKIGMWNPLPGFDDVADDGELSNIQPGESFDAAATSGTIPSVAWIVPSFDFSDHPTANISRGQAFVKSVVDEIEAGPDAGSTLIILNWDEWGGFYDHVVPPMMKDGMGYGFRVPLILYGPMVKAGTIDHQLLSSDAYLKLIEDQFLGGRRIDGNDGRADSRPGVREDTPGLGDLSNDLDD